MARVLLLFTLSFFLVSSVGFSQKANPEYIQVELVDGGLIYGKKLAIIDGFLVLETESLGTLRISLDQVEYTNESTSYRPPISDYRLIATPSAYNLKKGEVVYRNVMVFAHGIDLGITNNLSLSLATEFVSLFSFEGTIPSILFIPKVTFPIAEDRIQIGASVLFLNAPFSSSFVDFTMPMIHFTAGSSKSHFSLSVGQPTHQNEFTTNPIVMFGGKWQFEKKAALVTDNWVLTDNSGGFFSLAGRLSGKKLQWDLGLGLVFDNIVVTAIPIPFVGLAAPF